MSACTGVVDFPGEVGGVDADFPCHVFQGELPVQMGGDVIFGLLQVGNPGLFLAGAVDGSGEAELGLFQEAQDMGGGLAFRQAL